MPLGEPIVHSQRDRLLAPLLHFGFLLVGLVHTLLGPILPMLTARWRLDDAEAGSLFIAQFTGAMIGSALSSPIIRWVRRLRLMSFSYAVMAAAVACLGVNSWGIGLASVLSYGFAIGLTAPVTNLLIAEINSARRAAALNILNFVWAVGAVAGPPLIALFARDGHLVRPLIGLAALLFGIALLIARRPFTDSSSGPNQRKPSQKDPFERSVLHGWASPYALLTGGLIFFYVGTETATAGWIASYAQRIDASASGFGTMMPSFFWAGLLIGRAAAPAVLRRVSEAALVLISLLVAVAGLVIILVGSSLMTLSSGAALAGLGLAAVFPTTFAIFTRHFGKQASQLTGFIFVIGGLGAALIPWLVGLTSARFGDLRIGLLIPLFCVTSMIVLQIVIIRALAPDHLQSR
jgi:MFS transporter, FHS family, glucose/mannose:H+ symporter